MPATADILSPLAMASAQSWISSPALRANDGGADGLAFHHQ